MRCSACRRESRSARFCNACGRPLESSGSGAGQLPPSELRSYTPKHLADEILASRSELVGGPRRLSLLFAEVCGAPELARAVGPEAWRTIVDCFFSILNDGVHQFEGVIDHFTGDGMLALFGVPAREDHAQRACFAALRLQQEFDHLAEDLKRTHEIDFGVRMGINSGEAVVGRIGDDLSMDYTAEARTAVAAERVQEQAVNGGIVVSQETRDLVAGYFEVESIGQFALRQEPGAVELHRLLGPGSVRTRLDLFRARGYSRFVGRVDEMAGLLGALERVISGDGLVVAVTGEAGVGKSRLCVEFADRCRANGISVCEGIGLPHGRQIPLLPILALLRDEFGIQARDDDATARDKIERRLLDIDVGLVDGAPLLFDFLGVSSPERTSPPVAPGDRQQAIFELIRRMLCGRSRRGPTVYLIEDLQWLDTGSAHFVAAFAEALVGTHTLLVVNYRPDFHPTWADAAPFEEIRLEALAPRETSQLLRDLLGVELVHSPLADRIRERTAGNPFFMEEVVRSLVETGVLRGRRGDRELALSDPEIFIPATVQVVLAGRIDRLDALAKEILHAGAVIGRRFSRSLLQRVAGSEEAPTADALRRLVAAGFLHIEERLKDPVYAFHHPLFQEAAYGSQPRTRRVAIHAVAAEELEATDPDRVPETAAVIAYHWERAGEVDRAVRWHQRTARWALARDPAAAIVAWQRIRDLLGPVPETPEQTRLGLRARTRLLAVGGWRTGITREQASALLEEGVRLAERAGDPAGHARLLEAYGSAQGVAGSLPEMLEYLKEAVRLARQSDDPGLAVGLQERLVFANVHVGRLGEALSITEKALAEFAAQPEGEENPLALFEMAPRASAGLLLGAMARLDEAERSLERALELAERAGVADAVPIVPLVALFSTMLAWYRGDANAASRHATDLLVHAERSRSAWERVLAQHCLGIARILGGQARTAATSLESSLYIAREHQVGLEGEADVLAFLADAWLDAGDEWRGLSAASEAVRVAQQRGSRWWEIRALRAQSRALLQKEGAAASDDAEENLMRALDLVGETGAAIEEPFLREQLANLARVRGDSEAAERELARARQLFEEAGAPLRAEGLVAPGS